jgi:hypothetical protein
MLRPAKEEELSQQPEKRFLPAQPRASAGRLAMKDLNSGARKGRGVLGGGSVSITKEGVNELKEAWTEVKESVNPQ